MCLDWLFNVRYAIVVIWVFAIVVLSYGLVFDLVVALMVIGWCVVGLGDLVVVEFVYFAVLLRGLVLLMRCLLGFGLAVCYI